ncbi:hypothetical protein CEQ23_21930 [Burkholderia cepacia]|uniref:Secreted protein n=1 Tax=Burkholderia cepacia TaxID=292 RepID=A0ABN5CUX8_BURCE|nr:hypothetical protein APZ15_12350 [Burkholderia cepacia ATCC 25416]ASE95992.1 hypothetical protein CEQ23_21930 [Burkholderia cepacia]ATF79005.1 hypothetical protein CO711_17330 [Burkholderia cepacia]
MVVDEAMRPPSDVTAMDFAVLVPVPLSTRTLFALLFTVMTSLPFETLRPFAIAGEFASTTAPDPVAIAVPVPPDATGSGADKPVIVPPEMLALPAVNDGTVNGPASVPPEIGNTLEKAVLSCCALNI